VNLSRWIFGAAAALAFAAPLHSEPIRVRQMEGLVHGFLSLRSPDGKTIASGDLIQVASASRINARLVYHFRDGSISDERAVFTQRGQFRLVRDHLVQKGPSFPTPLEMTIDAPSGQVTVRYRNDKGEEKVEAEKMDLPPDVSNGMIITLLKNIRHDAVPDSLSFVAATPKPRLVKLKLSVGGFDRFTIAGSPRRATHYVLKVDIGGLTGAIAPLVGKQPPDAHVWVLEGDGPAFVKSDVSMFMGGPLWRTELVQPSWR